MHLSKEDVKWTAKETTAEWCPIKRQLNHA